MKPRLLLQHASLAMSAGCLFIVYINSGFWQIVPALVLLPLFRAGIGRSSLSGSTDWVFGSLFVLAAAGIVLDLSIYFMLIAALAALAHWDLARFDEDLGTAHPIRTDRDLETHHLRSLGLAAAGGLTIGFLALMIDFQLSFWITVLLVLIALGCLIVTIRVVAKKEI